MVVVLYSDLNMVTKDQYGNPCLRFGASGGIGKRLTGIW
jgi:hypothetical protein